MRRFLSVCSVAVVAAVALAGCTGTSPAHRGGDAAPAGRAGATPSRSAEGSSNGRSQPADSAGGASSDTGATGGGGSGIHRCHTGQLTVSLDNYTGGMAALLAALAFRNDGSAPCQMYGFPGLQLLNKDGSKFHTDLERDDTKPKLITVQPGRSAWAKLIWSRGAKPGDCPDSFPETAEVTPPDETRYKTIKWPFPVCDHGWIGVSPVKPGRLPSHYDGNGDSSQ